MRTIYILVIFVLLALAVPVSPAHAGGVVTVCDEAHLLAALAGGGTVTFACSGTITLTNTITIVEDTTINGSGQAVTISGNNTVEAFNVHSGATLNLNELVVRSSEGIINAGMLNVSNCMFNDNYSGGGSGGAVYNSDGMVTVSSSTFSGNSAVNFGGGIHNTGSLIVSNSTFLDNSASFGGGISTYGGTVTVTDSIFSSNSSAQGGGGIYLHWNATITVSDVDFFGNTAGSDGGGGIHSYGTTTVSSSTFAGNSTSGGGGGIRQLYDSGTLTVRDSTFLDNSGGGGGGIHNYRGRVTVVNSTFSGNNASYGGGGIGNDGSSTLVVSNSTFSGNGASFGGGIGNFGTTTLKNTIVANSPIGSNCSGTITNGGGNLSYPDTTCPGINADPKLGPLQNNGGPTWTMALGPGSAAMDAGDDAICAAAPVNNRDQRGVVRPQWVRCDIGAFERPTKWLPIMLVE